jgi:hypothetical protein
MDETIKALEEESNVGGIPSGLMSAMLLVTAASKLIHNKHEQEEEELLTA